MDKKLAAELIRARLEGRIASILKCKRHDLPHMTIGSLTHFAFLLDGTNETIGGFHTTMRVLLDLLGNEVVWEIEPEEPEEKPEPENVMVN